MISLKNISKKYSGFELLIESLTIPNNGIFAILGKSGSGKTTLINIISGLERNYDGSLIINGTNIKSLNEEETCNFRYQNIGYVHQKPLLFETLTVEDNLFYDFNKKDINPMVFNELIDKLKIKKILKTNCNLISGGEKQRVCLARALLKKPDILILDEPTGNVDEETANIIFEIVKKYASDHSVIIVTHDIKLAYKFANKSIYLEDGKIKNIKDLQEFFYESRNNIIKNDSKNKLKINFQVKYILKLFKRKKIRNVFSSILSVLTLFIFSFIFILSDDVNSILKYNFSQYYQENEIILERKETGFKYQNLDSVEEYIAINLLNNYSDQIKNYGYIYESNFEDFFIDNNEVRVSNNYSSVKLSKYNVRAINEFLDTSYIKDFTYISKKEDLENDEIIISLNNDLLKEICSVLTLKASFTTLYNYLKNNDFYISFYLKNLNWQYEDEQLLKVVGFVIENDVTFYHSNEFWNEYMFETMMKLPSSIYDEAYEKPWTLKKTLVLNLNDGGERLFNNYYSDVNLNSLLFNKVDSIYFVYNNEKVNNKYAVYKNYDSFDYQTLTTLNNNNFNNFYISNYGGYISLGQETMAGFVNDIYFTNTEEKKDLIIDALSSNYQGSSVNLDDLLNTVYGGLNNLGDETLKFKFNNNLPEIKYNEIIISSSLLNKLNLNINDQVYFISTNNGNTFYGILYIKGTIESEGYYIYGNQNWSYKFFLTNLNIESKNLSPHSIILQVNENVNIHDLLEIFQKYFKNFNVYSPLNEINDSLDNILLIIEIILACFSGFCFIISVILLTFISKTLIKECINDVTILYCLGKSKNESVKIFKNYILLLLLSSFIITSISTFLMHIFISKIVSSMLNVSYIPNFNFIVVGMLLIIVILMYRISLIGLRKNLDKLNLVESLKFI